MRRGSGSSARPRPRRRRGGRARPQAHQAAWRPPVLQGRGASPTLERARHRRCCRCPGRARVRPVWPRRRHRRGSRTRRPSRRPRSGASGRGPARPAPPRRPGRTARRTGGRRPRAERRGRPARGSGSPPGSRSERPEGRIERIVLRLDRAALAGVRPAGKLWATNRLAPEARAAASRFSVPVVRSSFVRANHRSNRRRSGSPASAVI